MAKVYSHEKLILLPWFTRPKFLKDAKMISSISENPSYDCCSLYIPEKEMKALSPTMAQYWGHKKENMDKILMFKLGRFYEMFYEDAIACHIMLGLKWMGGHHKVHVGFPESML